LLGGEIHAEHDKESLAHYMLQYVSDAGEQQIGISSAS
jgi:hypothetical protein